MTSQQKHPVVTVAVEDEGWGVPAGQGGLQPAVQLLPRHHLPRVLGAGMADSPKYSS